MTDKQKRAFWGQFAAACRNLGITSEDKESYRHAVLEEAAGVRHLSEVNSTTGFEAVMLRLAADAGDWARAASFTIGNTRRIAAMVEDCARQVFELTGNSNGDAASYAQGILQRAGLKRDGASACKTWYLDYAEVTPVKIFQMLDSHRRRLIWRRRRETGTHIRLAYSFGTSYKEGGKQ